MAKLGMSTSGRSTLRDLANQLTDEQAALASDFIREILMATDPAIVATFLAWRRDPRIASLMQLLSEIGDDEIEQILFQAEEYHSDHLRARN